MSGHHLIGSGAWGPVIVLLLFHQGVGGADTHEWLCVQCPLGRIKSGPLLLTGEIRQGLAIRPD